MLLIISYLFILLIFVRRIFSQSSAIEQMEHFELNVSTLASNTQTTAGLENHTQPSHPITPNLLTIPVITLNDNDAILNGKTEEFDCKSVSEVDFDNLSHSSSIKINKKRLAVRFPSEPEHIIETPSDNMTATRPHSILSKTGDSVCSSVSPDESSDYEYDEAEDADSSSEKQKELQMLLNNGKYQIYAMMYGLTIVIFGVLLPIVDTATSGTLMETQTADSVFETFLFSVSLLWFLYFLIDVYVYLWKRKRNINNPEFKESYTHNQNSGEGGLYVRIGCGFFCMATLLHNGLALSQVFEFEAFCESKQLIIRNSIRFAFTFLQYAFLFKNSSVIIKSNYCLSYFGLAHLIVTNICVWFKFILEETFESVNEDPVNRQNSSQKSIGPADLLDLRFFQHTIHREENLSMPPLTSDDTPICNHQSLQVTGITNRLNIFLIPCAIEFSIICVTLYYVIWKNIGKVEKNMSKNFITRRYSEAIAATQMFYIDCNNSSKGLFAGILTMLITIIVIIVYLISGADKTKHTELGDLKSFNVLGIILSEGLEIFLLIICNLTTISSLVCFKRFEQLPFEARKKLSISYEELLEIFALLGVISFSLFRILAFKYSSDKGLYSYMLLVSGILSFLQAILQTILILDANRKVAPSLLGQMNKKGREQITFLIIINISIWFLYSVTRSKYANVLFKSPKMGEYANLSTQESENAQAIKWIIINTISYPLMLYFHFHSSCCLSSIWSKTYTAKKNLSHMA